VLANVASSLRVVDKMVEAAWSVCHCCLTAVAAKHRPKRTQRRGEWVVALRATLKLARRAGLWRGIRGPSVRSASRPAIPLIPPLS
jgi:hypothetical protein